MEMTNVIAFLTTADRNIEHNSAIMTDCRECHNEILMNIADEDLDTLADYYKEKEPDLRYASNVLTRGRKLRETRSYMLRFVTPGTAWRIDGTFFVFMEFPHRYDLAIFSLGLDRSTIYDGLMKTKRIHFERLLMFSAIPRSIYPTVLKVIKEKNLTVESDNAFCIYTMSKAEALDFQISCPEEFELKRLNTSHSTLVSSSWPKKFDNFDEYIDSIIHQNNSYGVFTYPNGELISWAIQLEMGNIGIVQTLEPYQRKGYASLAVKKLAQEIAEEDEDPTVFVEVTNEQCQCFFEKLGFINVGLCNNIKLAHRT